MPASFEFAPRPCEPSDLVRRTQSQPAVYVVHAFSISSGRQALTSAGFVGELEEIRQAGGRGRDETFAHIKLHLEESNYALTESVVLLNKEPRQWFGSEDGSELDGGAVVEVVLSLPFPPDYRPRSPASRIFFMPRSDALLTKTDVLAYGAQLEACVDLLTRGIRAALLVACEALGTVESDPAGPSSLPPFETSCVGLVCWAHVHRSKDWTQQDYQTFALTQATQGDPRKDKTSAILQHPEFVRPLVAASLRAASGEFPREIKAPIVLTGSSWIAALASFVSLLAQPVVGLSEAFMHHPGRLQLLGADEDSRQLRQLLIDSALSPLAAWVTGLETHLDALGAQASRDRWEALHAPSTYQAVQRQFDAWYEATAPGATFPEAAKSAPWVSRSYLRDGSNGLLANLQSTTRPRFKQALRALKAPG